jgi:poly(A) polymerase Pap1
VPSDADALIIVPEKVTYANDDRSIRPFLLIKTEDRDYTQVSKVKKLWVAMIDIKTSKVVHYGE